MFDRQIQRYTQIPLQYIAKLFLKFISPNLMTLIGFGFGVLMFISIITDQYLIAIIFLFFNRLSDGLDGVMARLDKPTPQGGYLDIVFDFIFYGGFVLSFGLSNSQFLLMSSILLFCYIGTGATFLAGALLQDSHKNSERNNIESENEINKSFYYTSGLVEGTETIIYMVICLLFPNLFNFITIIFAILCLITIFSRIYISIKRFDY
jgi:phosphatidylglycerophosphate synthase